jgi:ATP-dependent Zn protease
VNIEKTAYHEAGHAITALHLNIPFTKVSIVSKEDYLGYVSTKPPKWFSPDSDNSYRTYNFINNRVMFAFSGLASEKIKFGRFNYSGAEQDLHTAIELSSYIISDTRELKAYLRWMKIKTLNFLNVSYRWKLVEVLAEELIHFNELEKRAVQEIRQKYLAQAGVSKI